MIRIKYNEQIREINLDRPELLYRFYRNAADVLFETLMNGVHFSSLDKLLNMRTGTEATRQDVKRCFEKQWCGLWSPNLNFTLLQLGKDKNQREIYVNFCSPVIDLTRYAEINKIDTLEQLLNLINQKDIEYNVMINHFNNMRGLNNRSHHGPKVQ